MLKDCKSSNWHYSIRTSCCLSPALVLAYQTPSLRSTETLCLDEDEQRFPNPEQKDFIIARVREHLGHYLADATADASSITSMRDIDVVGSEDDKEMDCQGDDEEEDHQE